MERLPAGTVCTGKWTHRTVRIERMLGEGANGAVYLVSGKQGYAAMKLCNQSADAALEWNVLEKVSRTQSSFPGPICIDDWDWRGETLYFYLMEWISGESLEKLLPSLNPRDYLRVVEQIAAGLDTLHQAGMAFCDIKLENIMVMADAGLAVRFVDVGGVTPFGRSVRQFTPNSDRAFWNLGSRRSEPGYDICGLCLSLALAEVKSLPGHLYQWSPEERNRWLQRAIRTLPRRWTIPVLTDGMNGTITSAKEFLDDWRQGFLQTQARLAQVRRPPSPQQIRNRSRRNRPGGRQRQRQRRPRGQGASRTMDWTERLMWVSLTLAACMACVVWATLFGWSP